MTMMLRLAVISTTAALILSGCGSTGGSDSGSYGPPPPEVMMNKMDNAATVRFRGGCEVLFAPNGAMVKWSSFCTEQEKSSARRAYDAALNEKTAGPEDYRDV